jgi:hypothetical protein
MQEDAAGLDMTRLDLMMKEETTAQESTLFNLNLAQMFHESRGHYYN